jgi:hypothetical protein
MPDHRRQLVVGSRLNEELGRPSHLKAGVRSQRFLDLYDLGKVLKVVHG